MKTTWIGRATSMGLAVALLCGCSNTEQPSGKAAYKMTTETPPGIASPDTVETRLGEIELVN